MLRENIRQSDPKEIKTFFQRDMIRHKSSDNLRTVEEKIHSYRKRVTVVERVDGLFESWSLPKEGEKSTSNSPVKKVKQQSSFRNNNFLQ